MATRPRTSCTVGLAAAESTLLPTWNFPSSTSYRLRLATPQSNSTRENTLPSWSAFTCRSVLLLWNDASPQWNMSLSRRNSRHFLSAQGQHCLLCDAGFMPCMPQLLFFLLTCVFKILLIDDVQFFLFAAAYGQFCDSGVWAVHSLSGHFMGVILAQQRGNIRQDLVRYVFDPYWCYLIGWINVLTMHKHRLFVTPFLIYWVFVKIHLIKNEIDFSSRLDSHLIYMIEWVVLVKHVGFWNLQVHTFRNLEYYGILC